MNNSTATLQWICCSALQAILPEFRNKDIEACFYPYIGLSHTIRRKGSKWVIRISDHCRDAPASVLEAIVLILACRIMGRRPRPKLLQTYELFRKDPSVMEAVRKRRLLRGRKNISSEIGKCHPLKEIYQELNSRYFNNQIEIRRIGWGLYKSLGRLGHYDSVHQTVTLSPALDSTEVPRFVVRYIIYHEMLHAVFEDTLTDGPRKHHSAEFRRAEEAYEDFARAKKFLREFCGRRLRKGN